MVAFLEVAFPLDDELLDQLIITDLASHSQGLPCYDKSANQLLRPCGFQKTLFLLRGKVFDHLHSPQNQTLRFMLMNIVGIEPTIFSCIERWSP